MSQSYMPAYAPLVVMAFLGTGLALSLTVAGIVLAILFRLRRLAKWLALAGLAGGLGYLAVLLAFSLRSEDKVLKLKDRKYFCEIDCHLAYSIENVWTAKALGSGRAATTYSLVTVKTWFDPNTIASFRGNAPLTPNPREVFVVDESGRRYGPSPAGLAALEEEHGGPSTPLSRELRPGESYTTTLVFDLPAGIGRPRLFLGDPPGIEIALIGHENSPFHKKIYFSLGPAAPRNAGRRLPDRGAPAKTSG